MDNGLNVANESFPIDSKYFARSQPLSVQNADGWRSREHIAWLFDDEDEELHQLICDNLVMPYITGDFYHDQHKRGCRWQKNCA